ncbi:MAG TPA: Fic family protein [Blastocatellia bacterium]|nr:Fic family protein [Blastocatellia bacterium]
MQILSGAPNEWGKRLGERAAQFAALAVTAEERRELETWLIDEFVRATVEREQIDSMNALREVIRLTNTEGQQAQLTLERLIKLGGGLRTNDDERSIAQVSIGHLRQAVENACDWFAAESFAELNPIEQAAIVLLRLVSLQPFAQANRATALVAASLFTLRAELPPLIIKPQMRATFQRAIAEAEQMNIQPLVELIAAAVSSTLDEMIGFVRQARS